MLNTAAAATPTTAHQATAPCRCHAHAAADLSSSVLPQEANPDFPRSRLFPQDSTPEKTRPAPARTPEERLAATADRAAFRAGLRDPVVQFYSRTIEQIDGTETAFRHSGWITDRSRIYDALMRTGKSETRLDAFRNCGSACFVEISPSTQQLRLSANYCHDRFCVPCSKARSITIAGNIARQLRGKDCRFITLTLRHSTDPLAFQLTRLVTCFANLRANHLWTEHVLGGVYFFEVKLSKCGKFWHPHLHIIAEGDYINQHQLSQRWLAVTGDSSIVDIRAIRDADGITSYITKYATKAIDHLVMHDPEHLDEAITALGGRRLVSTFGSWRGLELEAKPAGPDDWRPLGRLTNIIARARDCEPWAIGICLALKIELDTDAAPPGPAP